MKNREILNLRSIFILLLIGGVFLVSCKKIEDSPLLENDTSLEHVPMQDIYAEADSVSVGKPKILRGELRIGHEVRAFTPCWGVLDYWVVDNTGSMLELYEDLTEGAPAYTPIFVEIEIIDKGESDEGFSADYESVYEIVSILETRAISDKDCE